MRKVIWLKQGLKEEQWGRLDNDIWGIGTDGHIDTFCRFAGPNTILLAEVSEEERDSDPVLRESYERMEENYRILKNATDQDGNAFQIIRVPIADLMTKTVQYDSLRKEEKSWFEAARPGEEITFYLAAGYMNFIIANDVVVTTKYWKDGLPESTQRKDQQAKKATPAGFSRPAHRSDRRDADTSRRSRPSLSLEKSARCAADRWLTSVCYGC